MVDKKDQEKKVIDKLIKYETQKNKILAYSPTTSKIPKGCESILNQIAEYTAYKVQGLFKQYFRLNIEVNWKGMQSLLFKDFINRLPIKTCIHILEAKAFGDACLLVQDINTVSALLERILGANNLDNVITADFTHIDFSIVAYFTKMMLKEIEDSFSKIVEVSWKIAAQETNPFLASVLPDKESVLLLNFEIKGDLPNSIMVLCFPTMGIVPYLQKYKENQAKSKAKINNSLILKQIENAFVEVAIRLGSIDITYEEFLNLRPGDILKLDRDTASPVFVFIEDSCKYMGSLGKNKDNWACLIEKHFGKKGEEKDVDK